MSSTYEIYRTTIGGGGRDDHVASIEAPRPDHALDQHAFNMGIRDYSLDQDDLRVWICPAHSTLRYYTYVAV